MTRSAAGVASERPSPPAHLTRVDCGAAACSHTTLDYAEIMLYGIAQALKSATCPAHAPPRLPFPSHARVVPCLGFVLSLCRRSSSALTVSHFPSNPAAALALSAATCSHLVPCVLHRGGRGVQVPHEPLRRHAERTLQSLESDPPHPFLTASRLRAQMLVMPPQMLLYMALAPEQSALPHL